MCSCNSRKNGTTGAPTTWNLIGPDNKIVRAYSSETEARIAASQTSGSRVRRA